MKSRFALIGFFALAQVSAFAALDASIQVKGSKQGEFKGSNPDKTSQLSVFSITGFSESEIENGKSSSATGGAATGKVKFNEFTITKVLDSASPSFFKACTTGESLDVILTFYKNSNGKRTQQSQAHFSGVLLTKASHIQVSGKPEEEFQFTYQKISWTWTDGGKTFVNDLTTPAGRGTLTR